MKHLRYVDSYLCGGDGDSVYKKTCPCNKADLITRVTNTFHSGWAGWRGEKSNPKYVNRRGN